ncbi:SirB2 family protein [uncultured Luteimonas sp.]|uniref:SirB2 family protein n=1 Tax=uncultured Luteimonas sp. TaxID=453144 RepID=UPI0026337FA0|nr:SirB2 family protein [uncultured Luteimonas sp.]
MIEFYPQIKHAHIGFALLSGGLFAVRGLLLLLGMRWPNAAPVRYLSYTIDTALLTAALMLLTILPSALYANGWLAVKVVLIVVYVVLGVFALRRGRSRRARAISYVAALLVFAQIYFIARSHHPLGALYLLTG